VEEGEAFLRTLGVTGDLRVRHHDAHARLEVEPAQFDRVRTAWTAVERRFAELGFTGVTLDPRGYRRGGLLRVLEGTPA
jgi:uncharacterized protein